MTGRVKRETSGTKKSETFSLCIFRELAFLLFPRKLGSHVFEILGLRKYFCLGIIKKVSEFILG